MPKTLCEMLSDPRIAPIAPDAIRNWDLSSEPFWNKTLDEIKAQYFASNLQKGFDRLYAAADTGEWYYPLYSEAPLCRRGRERISYGCLPLCPARTKSRLSCWCRAEGL